MNIFSLNIKICTPCPQWVFLLFLWVCPQWLFLLFLWVTEQAAIISLYSINWL